VFSFTPRPLYQTPGRYERSGEEKYNYCPRLDLKPGRPARILVSSLTELPRQRISYVTECDWRMTMNN